MHCDDDGKAWSKPREVKPPHWVNANTPRYDTEVSPRDYLHQVTGYYFGDPN